MNGKGPTTPFLTACWENLALVSYAVPPAVLAPLLPPHCEPDTIGGDAFVSLVAFDFRRTRVLGLSCPGHVNFPEINLRCYAHCRGEHGVVFIREMVARRLIATVARLFYNEPFRVVKMRSKVTRDSGGICVDHQLRLGGIQYRILVTADACTTLPGPEDAGHFFKEQRWGFGVNRRGQLLRYRVEHPPWEVHRIHSIELQWNWRAIYGERWAFLQNQQPTSTMLIKGSAVSLFPVECDARATQFATCGRRASADPV